MSAPPHARRDSAQAEAAGGGEGEVAARPVSVGTAAASASGSVASSSILQQDGLASRDEGAPGQEAELTCASPGQGRPGGTPADGVLSAGSPAKDAAVVASKLPPPPDGHHRRVSSRQGSLRGSLRREVGSASGTPESSSPVMHREAGAGVVVDETAISPAPNAFPLSLVTPPSPAMPDCATGKTTPVHPGKRSYFDHSESLMSEPRPAAAVLKQQPAVAAEAQLQTQADDGPRKEQRGRGARQARADQLLEARPHSHGSDASTDGRLLHHTEAQLRDSGRYTRRGSHGPLEYARADRRADKDGDGDKQAHSGPHSPSHLSGTRTSFGRHSSARPPPGVASLTVLSASPRGPHYSDRTTPLPQSTLTTDGSPTAAGSVRSPSHSVPNMTGGPQRRAKMIGINHAGQKVDVTNQPSKGDLETARAPKSQPGRDRSTQCRVTVRKAEERVLTSEPLAGLRSDGTTDTVMSQGDPLSQPTSRERAGRSGSPPVEQRQQVTTLTHERRTHNITSLWKRPTSKHFIHRVHGHHHRPRSRSADEATGTEQRRDESGIETSPTTDSGQSDVDDGGSTTSADSYEIEVEYDERQYQSTTEAVWLPCVTTTFANVCFLQVPLIVANVGLGWALAIFGASYLAAVLTWGSITILLNSLHQRDSHDVPDGAYQLLSRQLGSEFGGAVGFLYWLTFVVLLGLNAHAVGDAINVALTELSSSAGTWAHAAIIHWVWAVFAQILTTAITWWGVTHVSMFEAAAVTLSLLSLVVVTAGLLVDSDKPWSPGGVSSASIETNWTAHPDGMSVIEAFCRCFPSTLGVLAVLSRPTDLQDPTKRLPWATLKSFTHCYIVFAGFAVLCASAMTRGKFSDSDCPVSDHSAVEFIVQSAKPVRGAGEVLVIGAVFFQCIQAMLLAPRVLQAIAQDHISPVLLLFQENDDGEPKNAMKMSAAIAAALAAVPTTYLYTTVTVVILQCFILINGATALNSFVETPHWRPTFRLCMCFDRPISVRVLYVALCGLVVNLFAVFAIRWEMALVANLATFLLARYLEYRSDLTSWGDGTKGLQLQQALDKLLSIEGSASVTKNWRPQLLVLVRLVSSSGQPFHERLLSVADQFKMGKGLNIIAAVIVGTVTGRSNELTAGRKALTQKLEELSIKGFCSVIASPNFLDGCTYFMQGAGLGLLRPNTVLLAWPTHWKSDIKTDEGGSVNKKDYRDKKLAAATDFAELLVMAYETCKAALVIKGVDTFPCETDELHELTVAPEFAAGEHIDLWWIVHDGSIELMIAFLLRQHAVWKKAQLRIFSICDYDDDTDEIAERLSEELARLKIDAILIVQPVDPSWIEEFHRTGDDETERRHRVMDELRMTKNERDHDVDEILDHAHKRRAPRSGTGSPRASGAASQSPASQRGSQYEPCSQRWGTASSAPGRSESAARAGTSDFQTIQAIHRAGSGHSTTSVHIDGFETLNELRGAGPQRLAVRGKTTVHSQHFECLNQLIRDHSEPRDLVIITLPDPCIWKEDRQADGDTSNLWALDFMEDMERMLHGLHRVILIRGSGEEIITQYW